MRFARSSYLNLASSDARIKFIYLCLDKKTFRILKRSDGRAVYVGKYSGSFGHAYALDLAMSLFDTNGFNILSDTDVAIVSKDWDTFLVKLFQSSHIDLLGTQLEPIGGFSSGNSKFQQYKGKPSTTWLMFKPKFNPSGLSMLPQKDSNIEIRSAKQSRIYGLPIGYELVRDTGWQIPEFIFEHKIKFQVLDIVKPSDKSSIVLKGLGDYHDEFHLHGYPILVHQRGSMNHIYRQDLHSKSFYDAIDRFLNYPNWSPKRNFMDTLSSISKRSIRNLKRTTKIMLNSFSLRK